MRISQPVLRIRNFLALTDLAVNAGIVTVLATATLIAQAGPYNVSVGDLFIFSISCQMVKGATTGNSSFSLFQSAGTGTVIFQAGSFQAWNIVVHTNGVGWTDWRCLIGRCTIAGTATFQLTGVSAGSNSTVAANAGRIGVEVYR